VDAQDALDAIEIIGGRAAGTVLEGRRRFSLRVRLAPELRSDPDAIGRLPIQLPGGGFAPLADLARIETIDEPLVINREATDRRLFVQVNVRGRDLGGFAEAAQAAIAREVHLPPGYRLEYGGQFENLRSARDRLLLVVPMVLALIAGLLYATFRDGRAAALILANVPMAATGGIFALAIRGLPLSISAGVGFIALFGVAVLNGLVLVSQARTFAAEGMPWVDAARQGALRRLRPVLATGLVASLGFVPMALATGAGAEVQRPLATVVIGGLITSTLLTLIVLPALLARVERVRSRSS